MHSGPMVVLVIVVLLCVAAGAVVLGYTAREARRDSREFWTPAGERLISDVRRRGGEMPGRGGHPEPGRVSGGQSPVEDPGS